MIRNKIVVLIILLICMETNARKTGQDLQLLTYNIGFNGVAAGIGAVINKKKSRQWHQSFVTGFYRGCLGGFCIYTGKSLAFEIKNQRNYLYCWPSRIVYSLGTSIVESAALNEPFGEQWNIDIWLFRCNLSLRERPAFKVRLQLSSMYSLYSMFHYIPDAKFDFYRTVMTGTMVFSSDSLIKGYYQGYAYGNSIAVRTNSPLYDEYHIAAHELIHMYQNREYQITTAWLSPLEKKVPDGIGLIFDKYICFDVSTYSVFYLMQGNYDRQYYYKNFYELEAEHFATDQYVPLERW